MQQFNICWPIFEILASCSSLKQQYYRSEVEVTALGLNPSTSIWYLLLYNHICLSTHTNHSMNEYSLNICLNSILVTFGCSDKILWLREFIKSKSLFQPNVLVGSPTMIAEMWGQIGGPGGWDLVSQFQKGNNELEVGWDYKFSKPAPQRHASLHKGPPPKDSLPIDDLSR